MSKSQQKKSFPDVSSHPDFVKMETDLLRHWYQSGIVKKYLTKNSKSKKKFSFLDGPITANNPMGVHHARGRTYKDLWQRYFTMKGYAGRYQNGFDCQGLWVEVEVEKDLGFKSKKDIEKYGVAKFVNKCKERVNKYAAVQINQSKRLAMWLDWPNSYYTMSDENNYAIWDFLKTCHQRNWIYKGHDSVPWCPRCETAISQHEMLTEDYQVITHQAIYFTLPLVNRDNEFLLVWTTTPWTIPANIAVAVDNSFDYSLTQTKSGEKYWLLKGLAKSVLGKDFKKTLKTIKGKDLVGLKYHAAFDDLPVVKQTAHENQANFHTIIPTDKMIMPISEKEGTGIVHTAVSAGSEDFKLGKKLGLPMIPVIKDNAEYFTGLGPLSAKNAQKHPELIFNYMKKQSGHWVYKIHDYSHRYPTCWRCKTELVWKVTDEWYIAMDRPDPTDKQKRTLRQQLKQITKQIKWIPGFGLDRELDWLKNMHDWLISKKNRFWGLCLPIYECQKCQSFEVIGSKSELKDRAVKGWDKFQGHTPHKPWVDYVKINCPKCNQEISRVEPVGTPWLDAGIVSISTLPENWFPADFITECFPGQFKNWFYSLLVMATVLKKQAPFKTVLGYESVVGEDGRPMHKSWGNAIEFNQGAEKIGVDVMRWMYCKPLPTALLPFGYTSADEIRRHFILILWNSYRFFVTQANADNWQPKTEKPNNEHILDKWILSRLQNTIQTVTQSLDKYYSAPATESLESFVQDFSTWYIRRSRDRVGMAAKDKTDKNNAYHTMHYVLTTLSQLLAPFIPYLSDHIYTSLTGKDSVHLADWPKVDKNFINKDLEKEMKITRQLASLAQSERKAKEIPLRVPLSSLATVSPKKLSKESSQLLKAELNVEKHVHKVGKLISSKLPAEATPEQKQKGEARKITRKIQQARKIGGTALVKMVDIEYPVSEWPENLPDNLIKDIKQKTLVKNIKKSKVKQIKIIC